MDSASISRIAQELRTPQELVAITATLLEDGATVPFIARYRKELTGGMDESKLRAIQGRMTYYKELQERRALMRKLIEEPGKLTDDIRQRIDNCFTKVSLEDVYLPFKPKRKTKATEAIEKGLEPLAEYLWSQEPDAWSLEEHADVFMAPEKGVTTRQEALQGASDIIAEWIAENSEFRKTIREMMFRDGFVVSKVVPARSGEKTKYTMYYNRREPVTTIPSHRVLAIRRGTKQGILMSSIECDDAKAIDFLLASVQRDRESAFAPVLAIAVRDSYARLIRPAIEAEVRAQLKQRADREAIRVFQENLANLLLSPPGGQITVIGMDPSRGTECKLAVVGEHGNFLEESVIYPTPPKNDVEGARATLRELIAKYNVRALAIGNTAGSREVEAFARQIIAEEKLENILVVAVNDAGATVYASSRVGRDEFPELDTATRSAITFARRLQDPLAELVKVDPKAIGVGQYQHDVDQKELHGRLVQVVESCVNRVGVDPSIASFALLRYVAGIGERLARKIVTHRNSNGAFTSRTSLLSIPGMTQKNFQQAAGFLRIRDGENLIDRTAIHPESYHIVEKMGATLGVSIKDLIENRPLISSLKLEEFLTESVGLPTLKDIREELLKPGRDPRRTFTVPKFRADVKEISDLKEGMTLVGTVTNVTNFGAFVDIGVHQDGLVHLSQISNRFIRDPRQAVKVGDVVQVKVISVEVETRRIGLSMKALLPVLPRRRRRPERRGSRPQVAGASATVASGSHPQTEAPPSGTTGEPARHRHQGRRPPEDRANGPGNIQQPAEPESKPELPKPTLKEKIAILQSKFRGIN